MWKLFNKKKESVAQRSRTAEKAVSLVSEKKQDDFAPEHQQTKLATALPETALRVFIKPISSEKISYASTYNTYAFAVKRNTNKVEIAKAFFALYKVRPLFVHTMLMPTKTKRQGKIIGSRPSWKKALIKVPKDAKIDIFAGV